MNELIKQIEWNDYIEILTYGNPPIYIQLLLLIGLVITFWFYRTIARKKPMPKGRQFKYKFLFFAAATLILFQEKLDLGNGLNNIGL